MDEVKSFGGALARHFGDRRDTQEGYSQEEREAYEGSREQLEQDTPASKAFTAAFDNPEDFDFGMEAERADTGFANFGFDPEKAAQLREAEEVRMAEAQLPVLKIGSPIKFSDHDFTVTEIKKSGVVIGNAQRTLEISHDQAMVALRQTQAV